MKIHSVNNSKQYTPIRNIENKTTQPPAFKGGADVLLGFWDAVGRGGVAANFLLQDMMGSAIPRTTVELFRDKKETGKLNYIAGGETAIREFTTSPSMFVVPAVVMAGLTTIFGKANNVPLHEIVDFSEIAKTTLETMGVEAAKNNEKAFQKEFYNNVLKDIKKADFDGVDLTPYQDKINEIMKDVESVASGTLKKRNFFKKLANKGDGTSLDEVISRIDSNFSYIKQHALNDYAGDFTSASLKKGAKSTPLSKLFNDTNSYFRDFSKCFAKKADDVNIETFVKRFSNNRIAGRFLTGILVTGATAITMISIPKLYQLSKTNPVTKGESNQSSEEVKCSQ